MAGRVAGWRMAGQSGAAQGVPSNGNGQQLYTWRTHSKYSTSARSTPPAVTNSSLLTALPLIAILVLWTTTQRTHAMHARTRINRAPTASQYIDVCTGAEHGHMQQNAVLADLVSATASAFTDAFGRFHLPPVQVG